MFAVVYFPNANLDKINDFRKKYNHKDWEIIQPHLTIVFPINDISADLLQQHIESVANKLKSFPIHLNGLTKSFDDYLFLEAKEGNDEIIKLHSQLYSGMLASYLRADIPFSPHLTLGHFRTENDDFDKESYDKAYTEASGMNLNINCNFDNINLIRGDGLSPVQIIKTFKLDKSDVNP